VILATRPDLPLAERALRAGIEVFPIRPINEGDPVVVSRLVRLLRRRRPDVLHVHASHALLLGWLASFLVPRVPLVATRRVDLTIYRPWTMRVNLLKYRWRVRHLIAVSNAVRLRLIQDGLPSERITVVHSGVNLDGGTATGESKDTLGRLRDELRIPRGLPVIFSAGALVEGKGYATLIDAAARVLVSHDAVFLIAGEGGQRDDLLRRIQSRELQGRVHLLGFREDVSLLMRLSDVYVQPSYQEALGTSIQDALVAGVPVVASRVGGIPEIVEDGVNGLLAAPRDPAEFADALVSLLDSPERRQELARAGRERVEREFSVDSMLDGTLAVYRRVLCNQ